jgi:glycosyltransferase involved in cell wall biosynthesis
VVRNPAADAAFALRPTNWPGSEAGIRLLYTGSVYSAQADALRNLLAAIRMIEGFELTIHTAQSAEQLAQMGLDGPGLRVLPHLHHAEALAAQQAADILFLPLAFESNIPEVIRSSAPAKAAEYLASGRPVLVHAPPGAYVNRLFGPGKDQQGAGLVVDQPDPAALAAVLCRLRDEPGLRSGMATRAARLAADFRVSANQAQLFGTIMTGGR